MLAVLAHTAACCQATKNGTQAHSLIHGFTLSATGQKCALGGKTTTKTAKTNKNASPSATDIQIPGLTVLHAYIRME